MDTVETTERAAFAAWNGGAAAASPRGAPARIDARVAAGVGHTRCGVLARALLAYLLLALTWLGAAHADTGVIERWPVSGRLTFEVLRGEDGLKLGEARHAWTHDGSRYEMELQLETTGLAGVLYRFQYTQRSEGRVRTHGLQPERFSVSQSGRQPESSQFDWGVRKVAVTRKGVTTDYALEAGDQDVLSVWHLVATIGIDALPAELSLVTNRRVSEATVERLGPETLRLPVGTLATERIRIRARTGRLTIDFWIADQYRGVPVRILMTDDKGEVLDQKLMSVEIDT